MEILIGIWSLSIVRACRIAGLSRRAWYRKDGEEKRATRDVLVIEALNEIVGAHPRWGFWLCFTGFGYLATDGITSGYGGFIRR